MIKFDGTFSALFTFENPTHQNSLTFGCHRINHEFVINDEKLNKALHVCNQIFEKLIKLLCCHL